LETAVIRRETLSKKPRHCERSAAISQRLARTQKDSRAALAMTVVDYRKA